MKKEKLKVKLAIGSDFHLEFGGFGRNQMDNVENADVLILAGDITVPAKFSMFDDPWGTFETTKNFFDDVSRQYKDVIYIMGNHEYYHGDFQSTSSDIRKFLKPYSNVHFLDNERLMLEDTTFLGATLWTSMNNRDPYVMMKVGKCMNDFSIIRNGEKAKFTTKDASIEHSKTLEFFKENLNKTDKCVIVGHHAPSRLSVHPKYADQTEVNYGYHSALEEFILDHPEIKLWVHGHTHTSFDYNIGETRIVCNPRGYIGYEKEASEFALKIVEI